MKTRIKFILFLLVLIMDYFISYFLPYGMKNYPTIWIGLITFGGFCLFISLILLCIPTTKETIEKERKELEEYGNHLPWEEEPVFYAL